MHILHLPILFTLLTGCNGVTSPAMKQKSSILYDVGQNRLPAVETALKSGTDVNTRDDRGRSLLLIATEKRYEEMAALLVSHGADVNLQDDKQDSPFLYAGASGQTNLLKRYLAHGARFDVFNRFGGTALIPACERGHVSTVRLLANTKGFPIDHINRLGWTGLLEAVILGDGSAKYQEIVKILKAAGSDLSIGDANSLTALSHAKTRNQREIVKILESD